MFSYFQRPNGRRNAHSSVIPPQQPSSVRHIHGYTSYSNDGKDDESRHRRPYLEGMQYVSASSPNLYTLPPIPRIASQHETQRLGIDQVYEGDSQSLGVNPTGHGEDLRTVQDYDRNLNISAQTTQTQPEFAPDLRGSGVEQSASPATEKPWQCSRPPTNQDQPQNYGKTQHRLYTAPSIIQSTSIREDLSIHAQQPSQARTTLYSHPAQPASSAVSLARYSKTRLNILNPMSLLHRRRSAQITTYAQDLALEKKNHIIPSMKLQDDYDPRIRGSVVHDFSAPRPTRIVASDHGKPSAMKSTHRNGINAALRPGEWQNLSVEDSTVTSRPNSAPGADRQHTPVFKEHFGLETEPWHFDEDDRRNQQTKSIMDRIPNMGQSAHVVSSLPPFARNLPSNFTGALQVGSADYHLPSNVPLESVSENARADSPPPSITVDDHSPMSLPSAIPSSPPTSPPKNRSRATSNADTTFQGAGLPKHFSSNASRFSFDLGGVGSAAQEKLLEEKHRQQAAQRAQPRSRAGSSTVGARSSEVEEDEDYLYDDMDDFDGFEERIPGVNTDAEEEEAEGRYGEIVDKSKPTSSTESPLVSPTSFTSTGYTSVDSPRDVLVETAAENRRASYNSNEQSDLHKQRNESQEYYPSSQYQSDELPFIHKNAKLLESSVPTDQLYIDHEEDDLYFDDGIIEDIDEGGGPDFDESLFDDDTSRIYGLPLRDLKPLPAVAVSISTDPSQPSTRPISFSSIIPVSSDLAQVNREIETIKPLHSSTLPRNPGSFLTQGVATTGLTHDNLAAYHDALAFAATQAALTGRFDRQSGTLDSGKLASPKEGREQKVMFDEQHPESFRDFDTHSIPDDTGRFDFDDNLEDDSIIAAANAEALENDDEGFYGQEFGFFARANGTGEAEYSNGGYFGPAGADGLRRSHSGRANFQEPSLTPITERSEWSNRNSAISLALQGGYPQSFPNAGLAQLADSFNFREDDMSLSALLRLRRGAWGGSNVSLPSSVGSQKSSSPQTYLPPMMPSGMLPNGISSSNPAGSSHSLISENGFGSGEESLSGSPTLRLQTQGLAVTVLQTQADRSNGSDSSPKRRNALKGPGHSRNSSGAESVSYVKEVSEDGAGRWVLEKRRTAEGGQVEILGRRVVEGGRI